MKLKKEPSVRRCQGKGRAECECECEGKEVRRRTGTGNETLLREREQFLKVEMRGGGERRGTEKRSRRRGDA